MPSIPGSNVGILIRRHTFCIQDSLFVSTSKRIFCHQPFCYIKGDQAEITDDLEEHRK